MNKEGWEIKELGEIAEIEYGTRIVKKNEEGTIYPVYGGGGITFYADNFNRENRMVIGRFGLSPKCTRYINGKFFLNDSGLTVKVSTPSINQNYLDAFLICSNDKIYSLSRGAAQKNLNVNNFISLLIPAPPLPIQEQIVKELDTLSDIIAKKKEQLTELDTLAQATFYDMFGDPVENEKDWEKKKFGELYDSRLGKMLDSKKQIQSDEQCPYIGNSNVQWGKFVLDNLQLMTFNVKEKESLALRKGDLLICEGGEAGRCAIWEKDNSNIYFQKAIHRARKMSEKINSLYVQKLFFYLKINGGLKDFITKSTIEHLTGEKLKTIPLPIPPLPLQNQFAERIEAIEKQKELINKSIVDVQLLFDYTMDKYFN